MEIRKRRAGHRYGRHTFVYQICGLLPRVDDTLEIGTLQCGTTDKATVNIRLCEQFLCVRGLAAATIENAYVLGSLSTELFGNGSTDKCMHLFCLV